MKKQIIICCIALATVVSCKKNQAGGNAEVSGRVVHHSKNIPNASVYVKYNATEFPGEDVSKYDHQFSADASGAYTFKCYKGSYYLYAVGIDAALGEQVTGGIPVKLRAKEKVAANIAVTEVH